MASKLSTPSKIVRTSRGQLPRNYVAGSKSMLRHPLSIGRIGNSDDAGSRFKPKKRK